MKKIYVVLLATMISASVMAQKGKNYLGGGAELALPVGEFSDDFKRGMGVYLKALVGVGESGAVTFTTGYSAFKEIADYGDDLSTTATIIPILIGYRYNFNGFFVEPQLGLGVYPYKYNSEEDGFYASTHSAFTAAAGVGYVFNNNIEISARYQTGKRNGYNIGVFGLRLGYNFSLAGQTKKAN